MGCEAVYLTFDIDLIDAFDAPGNGGIMFNGLSATEGLQIMDILAQDDKIKAFDLNEVNPSMDVSELTAKLASTAIFKFLMPKLFLID
jgi:arginase family enzyme